MRPTTMENYLNKTSLFTNPHRNRITSSYISHQDYFNRQQKAQAPIPTHSTFKKEYLFAPAHPNNTPPISQSHNNDILRPTVKKELFVQEPIPTQQPPKKEESHKKEESKASGSIKHSKKAVEPEMRIEETNQSIKRTNTQDQIPKLRQSIKQVKESMLRSNTEIIQSKPNISKPPSIKEQQSNKLRPNDSQVNNPHVVVLPSPASTRQIAPNDYLYSSNSQQSYSLANNPYQEHNIYRTSNGQFSLRKVQSKSFDPLVPLSSIAQDSLIAIETPRETMGNPHNSGVRRKETQTLVELNRQSQKQGLFFSTRRDTGKYLESVREQLNNSCLCLETLQAEIDQMMEKNLQAECEKLRWNLQKVVEEEVEQFRANELRELEKQKFNFMADLYEIKCNIDFRIQEIDDHEHTLRHQHQWKKVVASIITPNYDQNIMFLIQKSNQIHEEAVSNASHFLALYNQRITRQITSSLKADLRYSLQEAFDQFRSKKKPQSQPEPLIQSEHRHEDIQLN